MWPYMWHMSNTPQQNDSMESSNMNMHIIECSVSEFPFVYSQRVASPTTLTAAPAGNKIQSPTQHLKNTPIQL